MAFNDGPAKKVFSAFSCDWEKNGYRGDVPHKKLPSLATKEKQADMLFFYALASSNRSTAETIVNKFITLMKETPDIINPERVVANRTEWVKKTIADKFRASRHIALSWHHNAEVLMRNFDGSALNIYANSNSFAEIWERVQSLGKQGIGFKAIRIKSLCLFLSLMQENGLIRRFSIPLTIDFHVLRILWAFDIADFSEYAQPLKPTLSGQETLRGIESVKTWETHIMQCAKWSLEIFKQTKLDQIAVNRRIWELSRLDCKRYPKRCSACEYKQYCKWEVPASPFYRFSGLLVRKPRKRCIVYG